MYSLTIVGGGAISCGYDSPKDENILTHVHAALKHPLIKLDSIIEVDEQRQKYILDKWGKAFDICDSLENSISKHRSDIFVVATPTSLHFKIINNILSIHSPKLIICEKPIVSNLSELENLNTLINKHKIKIITNFPRRFDKSMNLLKDKISDIKEKYHFTGTFTKGLIHNGSHMIDLISMLIGKILNISAINKKIIDNDFFGKFLVQTEACDGIITNVNSSKLSIFELVIYTNAAKIEIIGASQETVIKYTDKTNLTQSFETYSLKTTLPYTLKKSAYNTFEYAIKLLENDVEYNEFVVEQYNINKLIFDTHGKFMENQ
ncbi:oxidoreductase, NAD-binding [Sulfurimonas gotlandica GD1]|uniref:Oxidoreductase, NAD-binding n=1 Tax=Sulfurimonas gotlandica (strain DSM 19862 / JCM 16533 / GD1) TaxID=929558 RepID=H1FVB5_SULGG|nr:Gfo/Idh/MocA family oxidoreductase [Sulfurimonas gotlandica]EHP29041.1 oxidoreductase, NAD-binding [Sulfurimonas gotlandica GD1]